MITFAVLGDTLTVNDATIVNLDMFAFNGVTTPLSEFCYLLKHWCRPWHRLAEILPWALPFPHYLPQSWLSHCRESLREVLFSPLSSFEVLNLHFLLCAIRPNFIFSYSSSSLCRSARGIESEREGFIGQPFSEEDGCQSVLTGSKFE
jgi:hypothetical protein